MADKLQEVRIQATLYSYCSSRDSILAFAQLMILGMYSKIQTFNLYQPTLEVFVAFPVENAVSTAQ